MSEIKEENLHKELDLIQAVITRMAQNAFYVKGWSITLVAVVLALGDDDLLSTAERPYLLGLILVVWLAFWYLDAYFLRLERMYRKLYEYVVANKDAPKRLRYNLNVKPYVADTPTEWQIMLSISLRVFYGMPALLLVGLFIYATH